MVVRDVYRKLSNWSVVSKRFGTTDLYLGDIFETYLELTKGCQGVVEL